MRAYIPFNRVSLGEEERAAVLRALEEGNLGGNGPIGAQVQERLRLLLGVRHALLTTSCSHALEMAAMALRLAPGDEVIMPSFTFVTTASSVVRQGARPVFADIDERTYNLDPEQVERHITPATRAILPVHYAGQGCEMDAMIDIARRHRLYIIEDAAQGIGARYGGRYLGAIGDIGCFSFHVTKNIIGGEGGAFVTNNDEIAERAEIIREKGTNRSRYLRGEADKYTWVDVGSSFVPSDLIAAIILVQLDKMEKINQSRRAIWQRYQHGLQDLASRGYILLPYVLPEAEINGHIYAFRVSDPKYRDIVLDELKRRGVSATFHFVPLHSSPYARMRWGYRAEDLPVTERVAASLIRLPVYPDLTVDRQEYIIETIYDIFAGLSRTAHYSDALSAVHG